MICEEMFRLKRNGEPYWNCYCRKPELIENYDKAISDKTQTWEVHHRREELYSQKELIEQSEYYDVPPEDLIFLTRAEHSKIDSYCRRQSEALKGKKRPPFSEEHKRKIREAQSSKKVLCIETGEIFESAWEAQRKTGINQSNISKVCRGKYKTTGGFHWKFLQLE